MQDKVKFSDRFWAILNVLAELDGKTFRYGQYVMSVTKTDLFSFFSAIKIQIFSWAWILFLVWRGPNYGIENLQQHCESLEKRQHVTDITLRTLRYEYNNNLPKIKQSRAALHSGWSCSCMMMGHNEMEATHSQRYFSQRGIGGTNKSV